MNSMWTTLLVLPVVTFFAPPPFPGRENKLEIGGTPYLFRPVKLILSTPSAQMKGKRMFRLIGRLVPTSGDPISMELTASEAGSIYLLKLARPRGEAQDVWAATLKTKVEILDLQAKAGGRLHLKLTGPLVATLENGGSNTNWEGEILARFDGISE